MRDKCSECDNLVDRIKNKRCNICISRIKNILKSELSMLKFCVKCNKEKEGKHFKRLPNKLLSDTCSRCHNIKQQKLNHNKEKEQAYRFSERGRNVQVKSREKFHSDKNRKEHHKNYNIQWRLNNPEASKAITAKRRAAKLKRTPKWANLKLIKQFYLNCPKGYHVDHIIPLQGKTVSGLHVENNLQYLLPSENSKKGNKITI